MVCENKHYYVTASAKTYWKVSRQNKKHVNSGFYIEVNYIVDEVKRAFEVIKESNQFIIYRTF